MNKNILWLLLLSLTSGLYATEESGVYIRGGFDIVSGSSKVRRDDNGTKSLFTSALVGNAVDLTLGYERPAHRVRFFMNSKISYDNVGTYEIKSTRYAGGIEGYTPLESINLNYGAMMGGGKAIFSNSKTGLSASEPTGFLGAELYAGADGKLKGGFGYWLKFGFDAKGYDPVVNELLSDNLVIYALNLGFGLSYKF